MKNKNWAGNIRTRHRIFGFTSVFVLTGVFLLPQICLPAIAAQAAGSQSRSPRPDFSVRLIAAGDNLIHSCIYRQASRITGGKGYDFTHMYRYVKPLISSCTFAFVNQETPLAGNVLPLSSYPRFNSPQQVGTALIQTGFNLISQANNHSLDKGFTGIRLTSSFWAGQRGTVMSGIYTSARDYNSIRYLKKDGVTTALIAGTLLTNGISKPRGKSWCVETSFADILQKVKTARKTADLVVVSMHWGVEYTNRCTAAQQRGARLLAQAGADIIIGNHPHALQSVQWIQTGNRRSLVAYALGNFISGQDRFITMVGGLLRMNISRKNGVLHIEGVTLIPIVTCFDRGFVHYRIVPLARYSDAMAKKHALTAKGVDMSPLRIKKYVQGIIPRQFYS